jgi:hypothetical protein
MQVSVAMPGKGWTKLTAAMTKPAQLPLGWKLNGNGLYSEVWHRKNGQLSNWGSPLYQFWKPSGGSQMWGGALKRDVWYSNDNDFKKSFPKFNKNDQYIMRFAGTLPLPMSGSWCFSTRSDDGSRLYIDGSLVVNNDGNHGPRTRTGCRSLGKGNHQIVVTFFENGGGAMLQTQIRRPGGNWQRLVAGMTRVARLPPPSGMYLEAFNWNKKMLNQMGNPNYASWDGQQAMVAHSDFRRNVWYSNDNDFKRFIPGFNKNDAYAMRWSGRMAIPSTGTWCIKTRSDDGSQVWFDNKKIVDNDGNHGPRDKSTCAKLTKGWHKLVLTFFENGGGAMMQVSVKGKETGNKYVQLSHTMTQPAALPLGWQKNGKGMWFEAYKWNGKMLGQLGNPTYDTWHSKPFVTHKALGKNVWYSNDNDFKKEIPKFSMNDKYAMRWSGNINLPQTGRWGFKTRSDDGSQVWVDGVRVLNNDGNHGPRDRTGYRTLRQGNHELVITFFENGGGAMLQASVRPPGGAWTAITKAMTNPAQLRKATGMYFEAYDWNRKMLNQMGNPTGAVWDKQTPFIAHSNFGKNVWYSNDNDFKKIVSMPGKSFTKNDAYAMRWTGNLMVTQAGKWCIKTRSDDGSQVWVNGKKIVDNDGNHGPRDREGCATMKKGAAKVTLTFFENGGGAMMQTSIKGPATKNRYVPLSAAMTVPRRPGA